MTHKAQLENKKYRNWVKAALGIKYVTEGLGPFCDHLVNQQHIYILDKVKRKHNLMTVSCGHCTVPTLQPDHVRTRTRNCPLGQMKCNCLHPGGKSTCPNKVCDAIYDEIIHLHASTPPAPNWMNTDSQKWCTEPWSVAKCFINAPGYERHIRAAEFDLHGLLHVLLNNIEFQQHIKCVITGTDVFSKVRKSRNDIFHSSRMELEDKEINSYIDDMIELLEDETEIKRRQESQAAVRKLHELKKEDLIISTTDESEICRVAMAVINEKEKEFQQTIADAGNTLRITSDEKLEQISQTIKKQYDMKEAEMRKARAMEETEREQRRKKKRKALAILKETENEHRKQKERKALAMKETEIEHQKQMLPLEIYQKMSKESTASTASTSEAIKDGLTSRGKSDFQKKLVKLYGSHIGKVASLPRLHKDLRDVSEMFVPPWLTVEEKDEESTEWKEVEICMHEIFRNKEKSAKCIYLIGDAGSGKTMFCKMLMHFWCITRLHQECSLDMSNVMKEEIKRFEYLFYVSLRHCSDCDSIEKMLKKSFSNPALRNVLQNDSGKCLVILDGLDEWNPERTDSSQFMPPGLPGRELDADFTIITTSRQWKFDSLPISDREVDKKIKLKGIDEREMISLTEKTIKTLNGICRKSKNAEKCIIDLQSRHMSDISHSPLILQQLVCLWFNEQLRDNSKCAIYKSMLDFFLEWKTCSSKYQEQLYVIETANRTTRVTHNLSYLAYETLFGKNKETTLTFSSLILNQLRIPHDVIEYSLSSGILKEERNVSFSENIQSTISFFHKSVQEYLAAVYIADQFRKILKSQKDGNNLTFVSKWFMETFFGKWNDEHNLAVACKKCVWKCFGNCKTVVDILEQSNVLIMLCGLEPRLLTNVSEYFYNVTLVDKMVLAERNEVLDPFSSDHSKLINDIQTCILMCIQEVLSSTQSVLSPVYIADLYVDPFGNLQRYCQNIDLKKVLSIEIEEPGEEDDKETFDLAVKYLRNCNQLKIIKFEASYASDKWVNSEVTSILQTNVRTLKDVRLLNIGKGMIPLFVSRLTELRHLTSLQMKSTFSACSGSHNNIMSLGKFLNQTTSLQHISLDICCKECKEHKLDLSKHKNLRYVDLRYSSFCIDRCKYDNLETCKLRIRSGGMINQVFDNLFNAGKLKQLHLNAEFSLDEEKENRNSMIILIKHLLPELVNLSKLTLSEFTFTDNILAYPRYMKNLKEIMLYKVTMTITAWCEFIDSLPALQKEVTVESNAMDISDSLGSRMCDERQDALQYVRDKPNIFRVIHDGIFCFQFTTKKV